MAKLTRNFTLEEFNSKDGVNVPTALIQNVHALAHQLQVLRDYLGVPIHIISGYRSPQHNKNVGGVKNSQHVKGTAADIMTKSHTPKQIHNAIEKLIAEKKMKQGGLGLYRNFVHYDIRGRKARW